MPPYFSAALKKNKKAIAAFEEFPPSHRREYLEWVTEATTEETRNKRLATATEWIADGKGRNWKYERNQNSNGIATALPQITRIYADFLFGN